MSNPRYAVVMPVYNEEAHIKNILEEWIEKLKNINPAFIVINDGSKDNSATIIKELAVIRDNIIFFDKENTGHGQSCVFGYRKAIALGYDYIFQTDSDGQTTPDDFIKYYKLAENNKFILGYRPKREDGFSRLIISRMLSVIVFLLTGVFVKDSNVPFRFFQRDFLAELIKDIPQDFYLANILVAIKAAKMSGGYKVVDISFKERAGGEASVSGLKFIKAALRLIGDILKTKI